MTAGQIAAIITAATGLVTAVGALVHSVRTRRSITTWRKILTAPDQKP